MLFWLQQNIANILICAVLLTTVAAIVIKLRKDKQKGRSACGCNCSNCKFHTNCSSFEK